jgi:hypothetical protein
MGRVPRQEIAAPGPSGLTQIEPPIRVTSPRRRSRPTTTNGPVSPTGASIARPAASPASTRSKHAERSTLTPNPPHLRGGAGSRETNDAGVSAGERTGPELATCGTRRVIGPSVAARLRPTDSLDRECRDPRSAVT